MADQYTITLSDGVTSFDIYPLEENGPGNLSTPRAIMETNLTGGAGTNYFKLHTDLTYRFVAGFTFDVVDSYNGLNDGTYTVVGGGSSYSAGYTTIPVVEAIPDSSTPLGAIQYSIPSAEEATSFLLAGRGFLNYGENLIANLVHHLENFAHTAAPSNPISGQLWFDTSSETLYVRNAANTSWSDILAGVSATQLYGLQPVRAATTTILPGSPTASGSGLGKTLSSTGTGSANAVNPDGVTLVNGDRVLVKDQATGSDNGIYEVTQQAYDALPEISIFDFLQGAGGQPFIHTINVLKGGGGGGATDLNGWDQTYMQFDGHIFNGTLNRYYIRITYNGSGYGGSSPSDGLLLGSIDVVSADTAANIATKIYNVFASKTGVDQYFQTRSQPTSTQVTVTANRRGYTWSGDSNNIGTVPLANLTITQDQIGVNADYEGKYLTISTTTTDYYYYFTSAQFSEPNNPFPGGYSQTSHSKILCEFAESVSSLIGVTATEIAQKFSSQVNSDVTYFNTSGAGSTITVTNVTGGAANDATDGTAIPMVQVSTNQQGGGATGYILTRTTDFDGNSETIYGATTIGVSEGTLNGNSLFMLTSNDDIIIDTTSLVFEQVAPPLLNNIVDVTITSVADNEVLAYDNGSSTWINQTAAEAGLATSAQGALADTALQNVVEDTTPQLGGNLDVNGSSIVSTSNGDINLTPNGTGNVTLGTLTFNADQTVGAGQDNYVLTYDFASDTINLEAPAASPAIGDLTDVTITGVATDDMLVYSGGNWINTPAPEYIQDAIGTAIGNGTQAGIVVTYNDGSNAIDYNAVPGYQEFSASAAQTVFNTTVNTTANGSGKSYLQVFVNGVYQQEGASKAYQVTGANQITFNAGLTASDDVVIYSFDI